MDNLLIGNPAPTQGALDLAIDVSCCSEFIESLDERLFTIVGEHGVGLSKGQIQGITIARALLRDTPILIMDEATSSLDIDTEEKLLKGIYKHYSNKTIIAITHREPVIQYCDGIIDLSQTGNH